MGADTRTPYGARTVLSGAMIDLGTTATRLANRLWTREPLVDSWAYRAICDGKWPSGLSTISLAIAAGTDQFHAFARLLRQREVFVASLAALDRSCIETFGRGWWLLQSDDRPELEHRDAAMRLKEAEVADRKGVLSARMKPDGSRETLGTSSAGDEALAHFQSVRVRDSRHVPGYSELAIALMEAAGVAHPTAEYSHLSGASHGEAFTVGGLGHPTSTGSNQASLALPVRNLQVYTWTITHVLDAVMTRLIDAWDVADERERWEASRERSFNTFDLVLGQLWERSD